MIRLSEAIARANCVNEITPAFVTEAYNLLKQSIIHVEKDDIEMDEDEDEEQAPVSEETVPPEPVVKKEKTKVQYDKYVQMMNLIVRRLDEDERSGGQGVERDELIMWYLEQMEEDIMTEEQHQEEAQLVRKVLKRLKKVPFSNFDLLIFRITTSWRFVEKQIWKTKRWKSTGHGRWSMSSIQIVILRAWAVRSQRRSWNHSRFICICRFGILNYLFVRESDQDNMIYVNKSPCVLNSVLFHYDVLASIPRSWGCDRAKVYAYVKITCQRRSTKA
jgi:hypothetical protein